MLASSAENIHLWDIYSLAKPDDEVGNNSSPLQLVKQWNPTADCGAISDISWSNSSNTITCAPSTFGELMFCSIDPSLDANKMKSLKEIVGQRCIAIGEKDRLVATADQDSNLYLYSMRRRKLWQKFTGHSGSVTAVQFNASSSHIASGSDKGEIILNNIATKESSVPLLAPRVQIVNKLCYCPHKPSILAAVSSDGAVNIWDAGRAKLLHSANQTHTASATGLSFFSDSHQMLVTVGLDGKLAMFDSTNFSLISVTPVKSALTCVDVGGDAICVGSKQGAIYVFDRRFLKKPFLCKDAAHKSSVKCIKFRKVSKIDERHSMFSQSLSSFNQTNTSEVQSSPKTDDLSTVSSLSILDDTGCGGLRKAPRRLSSTPKDIHSTSLDSTEPCLNFSPLRDNATELGMILENGLFSPESQCNSICPSDVSLDQSGLSNASLMYPSIIDGSIRRTSNSVVYGQTAGDYAHFTDEEKLSRTSSVYVLQQEHSLKTATSSSIPTKFQLEPSPDANKIASGDSGCQGVNSYLSVDKQSASANFPNTRHSPTITSLQQTKTLSAPSFKKSGIESPLALKNQLCQSPLSANMLKRSKSPYVESPTDEDSPVQVNVGTPTRVKTKLSSPAEVIMSNGSCVPSSSAFSFKLMHNAVRDAMEEFSDHIHNDFLCMQMNILHMFQQQKAELLSGLQQQLSVVKELAAENQQLRLENKQLRKNY